MSKATETTNDQMEHLLIQLKKKKTQDMNMTHGHNHERVMLATLNKFNLNEMLLFS